MRFDVASAWRFDEASNNQLLCMLPASPKMKDHSMFYDTVYNDNSQNANPRVNI